MNYEIKSISPLSTLLNAFRIFLVMGFFIGLLSFFRSNPSIPFGSFWQRAGATLVFTLVYAIAVSVVLTFIAWLYNIWAGKFKGITLRLEQDQE